MKLTQIKCESMKNPISITVAKPTFAWKISSDKQNVFQTGWQIKVFDERKRNVWDSGKQEGSETVGITYAGEPLQSCTKYSYQITSWNNLEECVVSEY